MQKIITFLIAATFSTFTVGQTNYEKFKQLYKTNDTAKIKVLLNEWERSNPNDPELYTSAFNYYFTNSRREIVSINREQKSKQSFQLTDSTGKVVGFIGATMDYNPDKLKKAFQYI